MSDVVNMILSTVFGHTSMDDFMRLSLRFSGFGLSDEDIVDAIQSACDFFNIPMPRLISDLTNVQGGQTMFLNWYRNSYDDDVLCFDMQQLIDMNVDSKDAFSLVMTHECAHRVLQDTQFPGVNGGAWEEELAADFLMGVRAALWGMDDLKISNALRVTSGSDTHPEGILRSLFIHQGHYIALVMRDQGVPLTIQNLINQFMAFREQHFYDILHFQRKYNLI